MFSLVDSPIDPAVQRAGMPDEGAGAFVTFEGWVRKRNEGRAVRRLEYEVFGPLAEKEGRRIVEEAKRNFPVFDIRCIHRIGALELGELAVWVGVTAQHRQAAFDACRFVIDEVKSRVPIWKKEHYEDGDSGWINAPKAAG